MHELSITCSMLRVALRAAETQGARCVSRVNILVGEEAGVAPDCVRFYFERLARGTAAEGAELRFTPVPLRIRCPKCGRETSRVEDLCACGAGGEVISGSELVVESVEVEDT
uniref:Hydrogenase maturation factor HypA n=1 Tax=candidate division WOR-3 bacterium TaxID=2052148 RepID=A0A7C4GG79_UNCW3